jgi:hypothetical protein
MHADIPIKTIEIVGHWWLMPEILATWRAKIGRITA